MLLVKPKETYPNNVALSTSLLYNYILAIFIMIDDDDDDDVHCSG